MSSCTMTEFIHTLEPWLDKDYIRKAYLDKQQNFRLFFSDGGEKSFQIDDCSQSRLDEVAQTMIEKGIPVEKEV